MLSALPLLIRVAITQRCVADWKLCHHITDPLQIIQHTSTVVTETVSLRDQCQRAKGLTSALSTAGLTSLGC